MKEWKIENWLEKKNIRIRRALKSGLNFSGKSFGFSQPCFWELGFPQGLEVLQVMVP